MRHLCVFIAILAIATARPTSHKYNGNDTLVVESASSRSVDMVGDCTLKGFTYSTVVCQRAFFLSFRTDRTTPCGKRFRLFTKCCTTKLRKCYENVVPGKELHNVVNEYKSALGETKKMQCGTMEFSISQYFKLVPEMKDCPKQTLDDLNSCAKPWYNMFMNDRGNAKLCNKYQKYRECAKRVLQRCKFSFPGINWIFNKDLNPFCDKNQLGSDMVY